MQTLTYRSGGGFIASLLKLDPYQVRLLCPVCGEEMIFAPTRELAQKHRVHPGAYCSVDRKHLTVMFELND